MKKIILFLWILFGFGCRSEHDKGLITYSEADQDLVFRSKATKPPAKEEMLYVVGRFFPDKYNAQNLQENIESICYFDKNTLKIVSINGNGNREQNYLGYLHHDDVTVYYNLQPEQKIWMISRVLEYDSHNINDDSRLFKNIHGAVIHVPTNYKLGTCE